MTNEMLIRRGGVGIFAIMAVWELVFPRRHLHTAKPSRWTNNLGLVQGSANVAGNTRSGS